MKVTGYQIREALKEWSLKKDLVHEKFMDSLFSFENEEKGNPDEHMSNYMAAEQAIVSLQEAQIAYNLSVRFHFKGKDITLTNAIKRIGGIGRAVKSWRVALSKKATRTMFGDEELVRDKDVIRAQKAISNEKITQYLTEMVREENKLRAAIATANAREVDIDLDPDLLS